jgi:hypothetical protein
VERFAPVRWSDSLHPFRGASPAFRHKNCSAGREKDQFSVFFHPKTAFGTQSANESVQPEGLQGPATPAALLGAEAADCLKPLSHEPCRLVQQGSRFNTLCTNDRPPNGLSVPGWGAFVRGGFVVTGVRS